MDDARARKGLITVLICHLEGSNDSRVKIAVAELRQDWDWQVFICWYDQRRKKKVI
jgi:hypothetical protein